MQVKFVSAKPFSRLVLLTAVCAPFMAAQSSSDPQQMLSQVLQRLDALEKQNKDLAGEVHSLREELAATKTTAPSKPAETVQPTLEERVAVSEQRIDEQAQTKVEASQKFPVQLNGLLLFNAFLNSARTGNESPLNTTLLAGPEWSGATVRQTLIGLQYQGPHLPGDGRVNASLLMDFWAGPSEPGDNWIRLRQADLSLDWKHRSFSVGQQKALVSPYQPNSFAQVGIPPLAGAGNLWLWLPQARYEERVFLGNRNGLTGQIALLQTDEQYSTVPAVYANTIERARPALEGRVAFWHRFDDKRRFEIGSGFHVSTSHVDGQSARSRLATLDWSWLTGPHLQINGTFYHGQNIAGLGALNNGVRISNGDFVKPVESTGGWNQFSFPLTNRLTLGIFGGIENDRAHDLDASTVVRNVSYASNLTYHLGPNVVFAIEGLQSRTRSASGANALHNHYDLAVGYLF